ncbi:MAG: hypothetical protein JJU20_11490 [Opitutales bacterium]|nr:hypothetical protein [Opitutales bacterium]
MPINLQRVYRNIHKVQQDFPVNELRLGGADMWPLLRDVFVKPFVTCRSETYRKILKAPSHTDPLSLENAGARGLRLLENPCLSQTDLGTVSLLESSESIDSRVTPSDVRILHFGIFRDNNEVVDQRIFNRVGDALIALHEHPESILKLMPLTTDAPFFQYHFRSMFYQDTHSWEVQPRVPDEGSFLSKLEELFRFCSERGIEFYNSSGSILLKCYQLLRTADTVGRLIDYFEPESVYFSSYFNADRFGVVLAARRRGLPCVDVEHGYMGPYSPYGDLKFVPAEGSMLLPTHFWTWGPDSTRFLEDSLPADQSVHRPVCGGSTWHHFLQRNPDAQCFDAEAEYRERCEAFERNVLVALQPDMASHEGKPLLLPEHLLTVMQEFSADVLWSIRLHPRSRHLFGRYHDLFASAGIGNYDLETASLAPLHRLLELSDRLLTSFSTVAFEANDLGMPVGILDTFGCEMTAPYREQGAFQAVSDLHSLREFMRTASAPAKIIDYFTKEFASPQKAFASIRGVCSN